MLTRTLPQSLAALLAAFTSCFTAPPCTLRYLLVHPAGVTRDAAIEALWSELDPDRGVAWFKAVLGNLRRALRRPTPATFPPPGGSSTAARQVTPDVTR